MSRANVYGYGNPNLKLAAARALPFSLKELGGTESHKRRFVKLHIRDVTPM